MRRPFLPQKADCWLLPPFTRVGWGTPTWRWTVESVQEGSRWRYARPSADELAKWFASQPLDEGMEHDDYIGGVVLIPANEKVKRPKEDGQGTEEAWEQTYTPYVRVDTRISYFNELARLGNLVSVIEPVDVPRSESPAFDNRHMEKGYWWLVMGSGSTAERFLCCTMRVALFDKVTHFASDKELRRRGERRTPIVEGRATKAVSGGPDVDAPARAQTGAIGRALGVAGILVVGSGIASAEDLQELGQPQPTGPSLPEETGEETSEALNERLMALEAQLKPCEEQWHAFSAWWSERAKAAGWKSLNDAPIEVRRGMATKMQDLISEAPHEAHDSSPSVMPGVDG